MKFIITLLLLMIISVSCIEDEDAVNNSGWEKEWGSDRTDSLNAIAVSPDDMIYVGGMTLGELYAPKVGIDATLVAFNPKGDELWGKQWAVNDDDNEIWGLVVDDKGNIYTGGGGSNPFIMKFSADGAKIWEKFPEVDSVSCLALDNSGNVYAGVSSGDILKFSPEGKELWRHNISTEDTEGLIKALAVDSEGNIYAGGEMVFFDEGEAFLLKITPNGTKLWEKYWGDNGGVQGIVLDEKESIYVGGGGDSEKTGVIKFDFNGNKKWETPRTGFVNDIAINENGEVFCTGRANEENTPAITKFDEKGAVLWEYIHNKDVELFSIACDSYGNVYAAGEQNDNNYLIKIPASEME